MRDMEPPSLPRRSEDGNKIRWSGIFDTSKGWREQRECSPETGHEQSWGPGYLQSRRQTGPRAWRRRYCRRRALWRKWAGRQQWYGRPTGIWSLPSSCSGRRRLVPPRRNGRRSTTSSGSAAPPKIRPIGKLSRWHACRWGTACGDPGGPVGQGGGESNFSEQSREEGCKTKSWGPGGGSGCKA